MSEAAAEVFGDAYPLIARYVDVLASQAVEWGLLGPREADRLWERHVLNSIALNDLIPCGASLVDVGSGAGLPGLPLAILRPDLEVTLLEPLLRRSTFLTQAVDKLGITDRVTVTRSRAEDHRQRYDIVASRALAPLTRLISWCAPLREPTGSILALKGRAAEEEVSAAATVLAAAGLASSVLVARAHPAAEAATIVRLS